MVRDLNVDVEILSGDTVREPVNEEASAAEPLPGISDEFKEYVFNGKSEKQAGSDICGAERRRGWDFRTFRRIYSGDWGAHGARLGWVYKEFIELSGGKVINVRDP